MSTRSLPGWSVSLEASPIANPINEDCLTTLAQAQRKTVPRRRWRIAWLLGLGVLVNYFDRVNLSVSHDALFAAFGISDCALRLSFQRLQSHLLLSASCLSA